MQPLINHYGGVLRLHQKSKEKSVKKEKVSDVQDATVTQKPSVRRTSKETVTDNPETQTRKKTEPISKPKTKATRDSRVTGNCAVSGDRVGDTVDTAQVFGREPPITCVPITGRDVVLSPISKPSSLSGSPSTAYTKNWYRHDPIPFNGPLEPAAAFRLQAPSCSHGTDGCLLATPGTSAQHPGQWKQGSSSRGPGPSADTPDLIKLLGPANGAGKSQAPVVSAQLIESAINKKPTDTSGMIWSGEEKSVGVERKRRRAVLEAEDEGAPPGVVGSEPTKRGPKRLSTKD